jgi:hypothetical protein
VTDLVSDYDFHPDEPDVRHFRVPRRDVLRLDPQLYVSEVMFDGIVLRHYAFHDEWFKVNMTFDPAGRIVEVAPTPDAPAFALNCDIATPMLLGDGAVHAVDLFADVLVRADGIGHQVTDLDELDQAAADGLVSPHEAYRARLGLDRLLDLISCADLLDFLDHACPFGPSRAAPALPVERAPLADLPRLQPARRPTWQGSTDAPAGDD